MFPFGAGKGEAQPLYLMRDCKRVANEQQVVHTDDEQEFPTFPAHDKKVVCGITYRLPTS